MVFGRMSSGMTSEPHQVLVIIIVSFLRFPGSMIADLEQLLGQRVQVVIRRSLSPLIRDAVLREAVPL